MVTITGIGNISGPASPDDPRSRGRESDLKTATTQDGLEISPAARQAVEVARYVELSSQDSEVRADRIEEARQSIESGSYKVQEALLGVAVKLLPQM